MDSDFKISTWTHADTIEYLRLNPLPPDFLWRHRDGKLAEVKPSYSVQNFGKWLKETPYFPGLFELIHSILLPSPRLPAIATLTAELLKIRKEREGQLSLF
jgi:hypothetical protein